jgi:hypothetical protein
MSRAYVMKPEDNATTAGRISPRHREQYVSTFSRAYTPYPCRPMYSLISPTRPASCRSRSTKAISRRSAKSARSGSCRLHQARSIESYLDRSCGLESTGQDLSLETGVFSSGLVYDQWTWMLFHVPSAARYTAVAFQRAMMTSVPSGCARWLRRLKVSTAISP